MPWSRCASAAVRAAPACSNAIAENGTSDWKMKGPEAPASGPSLWHLALRGRESRLDRCEARFIDAGKRGLGFRILARQRRVDAMPHDRRGAVAVRDDADRPDIARDRERARDEVVRVRVTR